MISIHAPRVGSDRCSAKSAPRPGNFNPRSPCGERRDDVDAAAARVSFQSTLPVWGATVIRVSRSIASAFQSTLPVWGATGGEGGIRTRKVFQSTLPVWGATKQYEDTGLMPDISIHAPRVGSDEVNRVFNKGLKISIHAPRVGSDHEKQSTAHCPVDISIHAPRVGSD